MSTESIFSSELCDHVRAVEELVERRVVSVVLVEGPGRYSFAFPGDVSDLDAREVLRRISEAAQDALKSL